MARMRRSQRSNVRGYLSPIYAGTGLIIAAVVELLFVHLNRAGDDEARILLIGGAIGIFFGVGLKIDLERERRKLARTQEPTRRMHG